ncbi:MAG: Gmad2 immunoglobulin-like domain-containing protein [Moorellales bacterium]
MRLSKWAVVLLMLLMLVAAIAGGCGPSATPESGGGVSSPGGTGTAPEPPGTAPASQAGTSGPERPVSSQDGSASPPGSAGAPAPVAQSENFRIFAPAPGSTVTVGRPLLVRGQARAFEATFILELEDGHNVLARQVVTADNAIWGNFEVELEFEAPTSPHGTLLFVTESAADGSRREELAIPLKFDRVVPIGG